MSDRKRRLIEKAKSRDNVSKKLQAKLKAAGVSKKRVTKLSGGASSGKSSKDESQQRAKKVASYYKGKPDPDRRETTRYFGDNHASIRTSDRRDSSGRSAFIDTRNLKGEANAFERALHRVGTSKKQRQAVRQSQKLGRQVDRKLLAGKDTNVFKGKSFDNAKDALKRIKALEAAGKGNFELAMRAQPGSSLSMDKSRRDPVVANSNMRGAYLRKQRADQETVRNRYSALSAAQFHIVKTGGGKASNTNRERNADTRAGAGSSAASSPSLSSSSSSAAPDTPEMGALRPTTSALEAQQRSMPPSSGDRFGSTPGVTRTADGREISTLNPRVGDTEPVNRFTGQLNSSSAQLTRRISPITGQYESNEADYLDNPYGRDWTAPGDNYSQGLLATAAQADGWMNQNRSDYNAMVNQAARAPGEYNRIVAAAKPSMKPPEDTNWVKMFQNLNQFA